MPEQFLVRRLADGPVDLIGDVHGEFDALCELLRHLGYELNGRHRQGRRLIFLGDLTDRGPNSPGVVDVVLPMVESGRADCVLGNHELNILLGLQKHGNRWIWGEPESLDESDRPTPQTLVEDHRRETILQFFRSLPIVLERDDLRVVHACWDDDVVELIRRETDAVAVFEKCRDQIRARLASNDVTDPLERGLAFQNENPIKLLTSGPEQQAEREFYASGRKRMQERVRWWNDYHGPLCVIGHYWRRPIGDDTGAFLFEGEDPYGPIGAGHVMCIDFSAGKRWAERLVPDRIQFVSRLAAMRWPERMLYFDDGEQLPLT